MILGVVDSNVLDSNVSFHVIYNITDATHLITYLQSNITLQYIGCWRYEKKVFLGPISSCIKLQ